ncbi:serine hydrolase [Streptomyces sp. MUM 16J]|uniref:serine hydrolase domain-containing protein n=1 Tax=Streptomyces sp. MUM 16J TaxID=2791988 RepID=UPI001F040A6D|nr:serine hydrolase domain-containing protein [Streptomyces sp. MUM 16J]MCH0561083.1 beta-lactamase family protein [Streptomyces sp. MUM 16J]
MTRSTGRTCSRVIALCTAASLLSTVSGAVTAAAVSRHRPPCARTEGRPRGAAAEVLGIVREARRELDLKAALVRVTVDGRELVTGAAGESMAGVPVTPAMHFRIGSVAIAYLGTILLQLVDEHRVGLDDPVSHWLPGLPHGDEITLRMLGDSTSGLHDYVTDPEFVKKLYADPFRQWTPRELVGISTSHPLWYEPGTNWSYSHANFVLLGRALEKITGTPLDRLVRARVLDRLKLTQTRNGFTPQIPHPVLHAYDDERGPYEESTYWNPSWTTAPGAVLTGDICDLARSAQGIGSGELLSRRSYRVQLNPGTVGLGTPTVTCPATVCLPQTRAFHFGIGVIVRNDWVLQNPSFAGYAAVQAYLPAERLAIAVSTTTGPGAPDSNTAQTIAERIAAALAPKHPLGG